MTFIRAPIVSCHDSVFISYGARPFARFSVVELVPDSVHQRWATISDVRSLLVASFSDLTILLLATMLAPVVLLVPSMVSLLSALVPRGPTVSSAASGLGFWLLLGFTMTWMSLTSSVGFWVSSHSDNYAYGREGPIG